MDRLKEILRHQPDAEHVNLSNCGIAELSPLIPGLGSLASMASLSLASNNLKSFDGDLGSLTALETLDIRFNPFMGVRTVVKGLETIPKLRELYIDVRSDAEEEELVMRLSTLVNINGIVLDEDGAGQGEEEVAHEKPERGDDRAAEVGAEAVEDGALAVDEPSSPSDGALEGFAVERAPELEEPEELQGPASSAGEAEQSLSQADLESVATLFGFIIELAGDLQAPEKRTPEDGDQLRVKFDAHIKSVLGRLQLRLDTNPSDFVRQSEILKTRLELFDVCYKELIILAIKVSPRLGSSLRNLRQAHREVQTQYPTLLSSAVATYDVDAEALHSQLDQAEAKLKSLMEEPNIVARQRAEYDRQQLYEKCGQLSTETSRQHAEIKRLKQSLLTMRRRQNYIHAANSYAARRKASVELKAASGPQRTPASGTRVSEKPPAGRVTLREVRSYQRSAARQTSPPPPSPEGSLKAVGRPAAVGDVPPRAALASGTGIRSMTLAQLREHIDAIFRSKTQHDDISRKLHVARETPLQHMYTYLTHKYGIKTLVKEIARSIRHWTLRFANKDNEIAVFHAIIENEIDEDFRMVQAQLCKTVRDLMRVGLSSRHPLASEEEIDERLEHVENGYVSDQEYLDVIRFMYSHNDAVTLVMRVQNAIRAKHRMLLSPTEGNGNETPVLGLDDTAAGMDGVEFAKIEAETAKQERPRRPGQLTTQNSFRMQQMLKRQDTMIPRGALVTAFGVSDAGDDSAPANASSPKPAPPLPPPFLTDREFEPRVSQSPLAKYPMPAVNGAFAPGLSGRQISALESKSIEADNNKLILFSQIAEKSSGRGGPSEALPVFTSHGRRYVSFSDFDRNPIGAPLTRDQLEKEWKARNDAAKRRIRYRKLVKILLDFQLELHKKFMSELSALFRRNSGGDKGTLDELGFRHVVLALNGSCTENDMKQLLNRVDPYRTQAITFTEAVRVLLPLVAKKPGSSPPPPAHGGPLAQSIGSVGDHEAGEPFAFNTEESVVTPPKKAVQEGTTSPTAAAGSKLAHFSFAGAGEVLDDDEDGDEDEVNEPALPVGVDSLPPAADIDTEHITVADRVGMFNRRREAHASPPVASPGAVAAPSAGGDTPIVAVSLADLGT